MKLKINGVEGLDGEYDVELTRFRNKDHRTIKELSGLGVLQYQDALEKGDISFTVAVAYLLLTKLGKTVDIEDLWEAEDSAIGWRLACSVCGVTLPVEAKVELCAAHAKGDARPPELEKVQPEPEPESEVSGEPSLDSMAPYPVILTQTGYGFQPSDTGSDSDRATFFNSLQPN